MCVCVGGGACMCVISDCVCVYVCVWERERERERERSYITSTHTVGSQWDSDPFGSSSTHTGGRTLSNGKVSQVCRSTRVQRKHKGSVLKATTNMVSIHCTCESLYLFFARVYGLPLTSSYLAHCTVLAFSYTCTCSFNVLHAEKQGQKLKSSGDEAKHQKLK